MFHWHIVDTHAYPVEQKQDPINLMAKYGSYSSDKIYTQEEIKSIVKYASYRGMKGYTEVILS